MPNVSSQPNATSVRVRVVSKERADDGWGAWADVEILEVQAIPGAASDESLQGRMRVFIPPPLVDAVIPETTFCGEMTFNGGPGGYVYALRRSRRT